MKRIFRGPWLWIVLAVVGVLLALQLLSSDGGYKEITTSGMVSNINSGEDYDWYYATPEDRTAQVRTPITDTTFGKPWVFRFKDIRSW